jgi:hypothetical protein
MFEISNGYVSKDINIISLYETIKNLQNTVQYNKVKILLHLDLNKTKTSHRKFPNFSNHFFKDIYLLFTIFIINNLNDLVNSFFYFSFGF